MSAPTVAPSHGKALIADDTYSMPIEYDDIPAVVAGLLAAQDVLADAR